MLNAGDQLLVCDNFYRPSRNFCDGLPTQFDIAISKSDPRAGATIEEPFEVEHENGTARSARLAIPRPRLEEATL